MYAHVVKFVLGADTEWEVQHMADIAMLWLSKQKGFVKANFLADYGTGEYQWITFWDTFEAQMIYKNAFPNFRYLLGDKFQWQASLQIFEVYEPKCYE